MKIYKKRGNKNYKERKMLAELEPILQKKLEQDPNFNVVTATNINELTTLYNKHVPTEVAEEDVQYVEEDKEINSNIDEEKETIENMNKENNEPTDVSDEVSDGNTFVDPLNRQEPIVRDYVYGDESMKKGNTTSTKSFGPQNFAEPIDFDEAFVIPDDEDEDENKSKSSTNTKSTESKSKSAPKEPLNPNWDEMKGSVQKKKTKKFAKYIVEAVATLQQKGFVYYANKDINEAKLNEYELEGVMDLSLLVTLEDGQEVTVKQFFQHQCQKAEELSHLSREQKEDLTDSLTEVLMEKGAGPTPTQELMLVTLTILGGQALTLMTLKSQTNSLLSQLKAMNSDEEYAEEYQEPWHQQQTEMTEPEPEVAEKPKSDKKDNQKSVETEVEVADMNAPLEIGETIETKE